MSLGRWLLAASAVVVLSGCGAGPNTGVEPPSGQQVAAARNCVSCHTVSGARSVGPTWRSLFGSRVELEGGRVVIADLAYLERSMRQPQADIVLGFTTVEMPLIELSDEEIASLLVYIESVGRSGTLG